MKPAVKSLLGLGVSALVDYLREEKPLRTWIRARRAAKGKAPVMSAERADTLANQGLDKIAERVKK